MQLASDYYFIAMGLIVVGIVLILLGIFWRARTQQKDSEMKSKGIILLGPIPIVWGFGEKGKIVVVILFVCVILFYLLMIL